jgi:hypothetical protein
VADPAGTDATPDAAIARAMKAVGEAQRALIDAAVAGAKAVHERQEHLARLVSADLAERSALDGWCLYMHIDWAARQVTFTQTTGSDLRVAINGEFMVAPSRVRTAYDAGPPS